MLTGAPRCRLNLGAYTAIKDSENGIYYLFRLCLLSKVTIYKTGSFQWSSTCAVVKTRLYLFGTYAYQTERPVQKRTQHFQNDK